MSCELMRRKGVGTDRHDGNHEGRFSRIGLLTPPLPVSSSLILCSESAAHLYISL